MATGAASDELEELEELEELDELEELVLKPGTKPLPEAGVKVLKPEAEPAEAVT